MSAIFEVSRKLKRQKKVDEHEHANEDNESQFKKGIGIAECSATWAFLVEGVRALGSMV